MAQNHEQLEADIQSTRDSIAKSGEVPSDLLHPVLVDSFRVIEEMIEDQFDKTLERSNIETLIEAARNKSLEKLDFEPSHEYLAADTASSVLGDYLDRLVTRTYSLLPQTHTFIMAFDLRRGADDFWSMIERTEEITSPPRIVGLKAIYDLLQSPPSGEPDYDDKYHNPKDPGLLALYNNYQRVRRILEQDSTGIRLAEGLEYLQTQSLALADPVPFYANRGVRLGQRTYQKVIEGIR